MSSQRLGEAVAVRFFMPSPALAPYITTYYLTEFNVAPGQVVQDWLHPEWANVRLTKTPCWQAAVGADPMRDLAGLVGTGPTSHATRFSTGPARVWGIGLLPPGWARLCNGDAAKQADQFCDASGDPAYAGFVPLLENVFGDEPNPAAEARRIDAYLLHLLTQRPPVEDEARIRAAHAALLDHEISSVGELAERLNLSPRSLERLSLKAFGFSPKLLLRRQRFLRSLAQFMLDPSLTWIKTLDWQYVDQAHFVRDFKRFMGMSPSAYGQIDHPVMRAAAKARAAAAGAAMQALHQPG